MEKNEKYLEDLFQDLYSFFKDKYFGTTWKFTDSRFTAACGIKLPPLLESQPATAGLGLNRKTLHLRVFCTAPDQEISDVAYDLRLTYKIEPGYSHGHLLATFHNSGLPFDRNSLIFSDTAHHKFTFEVLEKMNELTSSGIYQLEPAPAEVPTK